MRESMRDERRERIVQAAREAFTERTFDSVSMAEIAASAGIAVGTVYNYYPAKEALLVAVFDREIAHLIKETRAPEDVGTWARLALEGYAHFPPERWREFMASFYRGSRTDALKTYMTQAPLRESLRQAISTQLGPEVAHAESLQRVLFSTFYQGFLRWVNAGKPMEEVIKEVSEDLEATLEGWRRMSRP